MATGPQRIIRVRTVLPHRSRAAGGSGVGEATDPAHALCAPGPDLEDPAALIARAVAACYAETLGGILDQSRLPWTSLEIDTEVTCGEAAARSDLESIGISPTMLGGDPQRRNGYAAAAVLARDRSPVGHAIRGNVAFKVAAIAVVASDQVTACSGTDTRLCADLNDVVNRHPLIFGPRGSGEVAAVLDPGCTLEDVALGRRFRGRTAAQAYCRSWQDALGLGVTDTHCHRGEAGLVTVEAHCTGRHTGIFRGIEPTHRAIDLRVAAILHLRGGSIDEIRIYYDAGGLLRRLGVTTDDATPSFCGGLQ